MADAQRYAVDLSAATLTDVTGGGIGAGAGGTYLLNVTNRNGSAITIRLAITDGSAPAAKDYIEYDAAVQGNCPLSRWPIPLNAGWKVYAYSNSANVSVTLLGQKAV